MNRKEILGKLEQGCTQYNACIAGNDLVKAVEIDEEMKKDVQAYNSQAELECFNECLSAKEPMIFAVKKLYFDGVKIKDTTDENGDIVREIVESPKLIDILKLHKKQHIGANERWNYTIEKFNKMLTLKAAQLIGDVDIQEIDDSFAMNKLAKDVALGIDAVSDENLLATLQGIYDEMLGEGYTAKAEDIAYLKLVYSKKTAYGLGVQTANNKELTRIIEKACHSAVTGENYFVKCKLKKQK